MIRPLIPQDERSRLEILHASKLLDSAPDPFLNALVVIIAKSFRVPICAIALIDRDRQWFKASEGLKVAETSRECSFCAHTLWWPSSLVVLDASHDSRFSDNPLVTGEPAIRFYAGVPIVLAGACVGALCLIDHRPRAQFHHQELQILSGAAVAVEDRFRAITQPLL